MYLGFKIKSMQFLKYYFLQKQVYNNTIRSLSQQKYITEFMLSRVDINSIKQCLGRRATSPPVLSKLKSRLFIVGRGPPQSAVVG